MGAAVKLRNSAWKAWGQVTQGMPVLVIKAGDNAQREIEDATTQEQLLSICQRFMQRTGRPMAEISNDPHLSKKSYMTDCRDLFFWWLEFEKLARYSNDPNTESRFAVCRDVFKVAWERAASFGQKLKRTR
jgi:hypothetical protein